MRHMKYIPNVATETKNVPTPSPMKRELLSKDFNSADITLLPNNYKVVTKAAVICEYNFKLV